MTDHAAVPAIEDAVAGLGADGLLYRVAPAKASAPAQWRPAVEAALRDPIGTPPLRQIVCARDKVVVLVDDVTRPTPQHELLPPLLDELGAAGVPDANITLIIALGTHRHMTEAEIRARFGDRVCDRVSVINHDWENADTFVDLGTTERGTPVEVNRLAYEADLLIGTGSIVPHVYAGWGGGAKILQPGVCSAETTAHTHCMAADGPDLLGIPGSDDNDVRLEMERVAAMAGLDFILNCVVDAGGAPAWVGAGHYVEAHRQGVAVAREVFVRPIPALADIVIADARPAIKDYWQGIKGLAHGRRGAKDGGTVIFVGDFPECVAPTHPEFCEHSLKPYAEILEVVESDRLEDRIASATLRLHSLIMSHCGVICVSPGMTVGDKENLGFAHADTVEAALAAARQVQGAGATVGVIDFAGDVLPKPPGD